MTVKELYEWAKEHGVEDYILRIHYGDEDIPPDQGWGELVNDKERIILV